MSFTVRKTKGRARLGELTTPHGKIETPMFMPIATVGAVKTLLPSEVAALGAQVILGNTYHLALRPGDALIAALGGLHTFMGWSGPILTDSGGYQVFSLSNLLQTDEDGVSFQSHLDGSPVRLTPERSLQIQANLGSDIRMQFDDVAAGNSPYERYAEAMERSLRWAERSQAAFAETVNLKDKVRPLHFGIVQGGVYEDLRLRSVEALQKVGFDGYAIGGLSVGERREDTFAMVRLLTDAMPKDRPRYFMGGGMPEEIAYYVSRGVDLFDCVLPTRNARHGFLFTWAQEPAVAVREALALAEQGADDVAIAAALYKKTIITNEQYRTDLSPIDLWSSAPSSTTFSRAYLRHLFNTKEILGFRLATTQNLSFYLTLMAELRAILASYVNDGSGRPLA